MSPREKNGAMNLVVIVVVLVLVLISVAWGKC